MIYEFTDIPEGVTVDEWRRSRRATKPRGPLAHVCWWLAYRMSPRRNAVAVAATGESPVAPAVASQAATAVAAGR